MKNIFKLTKPGFTLAEVLITLGIIGVVAAMTIPTLMQKTNEKELVSGLLKEASVLTNALKQTEAFFQTDVSKLTEASFRSEFAQHLKSIPCNSGNDKQVCLADGSYILIGNNFSYSEGCTIDFSEDDYSNGLKNICVDIIADVNGPKGPNKGGKDQFLFYVTTNGVVPEGKRTECAGLDCTAYVLSNHKLWEGELTGAPLLIQAEEINYEGMACNKGSSMTGYTCGCVVSGRKEVCTWSKS